MDIIPSFVDKIIRKSRHKTHKALPCLNCSVKTYQYIGCKRKKRCFLN